MTLQATYKTGVKIRYFSHKYKHYTADSKVGKFKWWYLCIHVCAGWTRATTPSSVWCAGMAHCQHATIVPDSYALPQLCIQLQWNKGQTWCLGRCKGFCQICCQLQAMSSLKDVCGRSAQPGKHGIGFVGQRGNNLFLFGILTKKARLRWGVLKKVCRGQPWLWDCWQPSGAISVSFCNKWRC